MRILKSGKGWRLGWCPEGEYQGLVGGDSWAIELTAAELEDFGHLLLQLEETMRAIATELMEEEQITCELETPLIWVEAEGYPQTYQLRLIIKTGRRYEGYWPAEVVPCLHQNLPLLKSF